MGEMIPSPPSGSQNTTRSRSYGGALKSSSFLRPLLTTDLIYGPDGRNQAVKVAEVKVQLVTVMLLRRPAVKD